MACVVPLVTSWATRRPQRWPGGVNLHILPKKLPFHWLSAAAGVSDMHRPASAWFPDMNEVHNGLCGVSGHFRAARGHPRGLRRVKLSQAGSIGGFNDQGGCGCAHPAVRLFPLVPWASGVPRVAHRGAVGIARDPPGLGKIYPFTHPSTRVYNGPWGGPEVTGVCTRLFRETPGVLQRLRGSSLE